MTASMMSACRTIVVESADARRHPRRWAITYLDPKALESDTPPFPLRSALDRLRSWFST